MVFLHPKHAKNVYHLSRLFLENLKKMMEKFTSRKYRGWFFGLSLAGFDWIFLNTFIMFGIFGLRLDSFSSPIIASQSILNYCHSIAQSKDDVPIFSNYQSFLALYFPKNPPLNLNLNLNLNYHYYHYH